MKEQVRESERTRYYAVSDFTHSQGRYRGSLVQNCKREI